MVKSIVVLKRRDGMSHQEFIEHWRHNHAPLVLGLPGVKRYVQNCPVEIPGKEPPYDGVAEVWFDSLEALRTAVTSPQWEVVLGDEKNFMGPTTKESVAVTVEEWEVPVQAVS
ncbi:MAG: EthD family reductase [Actinobacteria bacterium]|nr:EthD family reductase [Actinomycetota bacterium]